MWIIYLSPIWFWRYLRQLPQPPFYEVLINTVKVLYTPSRPVSIHPTQFIPLLAYGAKTIFDFSFFFGSIFSVNKMNFQSGWSFQIVPSFVKFSLIFYIVLPYIFHCILSFYSYFLLGKKGSFTRLGEKTQKTSCFRWIFERLKTRTQNAITIKWSN